MEVHGHLGDGFLEAVYNEALAIERATREIPFRREVELPVAYKGQAPAVFISRRRRVPALLLA